MENNEIEEIKSELLELSFNVNSIGIVYWIEAIRHIKNNPLEWDICNIYEVIAQRNNSTVHRVERAMRHAINPAKENIQKKYKYYGKIRNSTFLNLIRFKLI